MKTNVMIQETAHHAREPVGSHVVIDTEDLGKRYEGGVTALQGFDLDVPRHSIFGFLGPNGAGKTTAIKLLLGLTRPTSGRATIFGLDSVRDSLEIRSRVGYLAQDPRFYGHLTARETLEFAARFFYRGPAGSIARRIDETLELVGLVDKADRPTKGFSGGERQRLGIAQAQINYPDLLILDEPAAALDPIGRRDVLEVMERLQEHTTIFYSTHILDDVQRVSDHVAILDHGRLLAQAPTTELLNGTGTTYRVTVRGDASSQMRALALEPWVVDTSVQASNGTATVTVNVADERIAEDRLLRTVLAVPDTVVTDFGRRTYNLEDVFLHLVEGRNE